MGFAPRQEARNPLTAYDPVMPLDLPDGPVVPGPEWWYWLGGRPALDFVNTRRERWRRSVDCLTRSGDVVLWLAGAGLLEDAAAPAPAGLLRQARELREAIDACVVAVTGAGAAPGQRAVALDPAAVAIIDEWLAFAPARPQLALDPAGLPQLDERPAGDSPRRALGLVALDAARMLGTPAERARVRICASETCSARFFDRSPAARRRWCSMQACGNVAKARRHRARKGVT
jgi:predicted RNA-binding Zn ribbon-like protein